MPEELWCPSQVVAHTGRADWNRTNAPGPPGPPMPGELGCPSQVVAHAGRDDWNRANAASPGAASALGEWWLGRLFRIGLGLRALKAGPRGLRLRDSYESVPGTGQSMSLTCGPEAGGGPAVPSVLRPVESLVMEEGTRAKWIDAHDKREN